MCDRPDSWWEPEDKPYTCACCGKELKEYDECVQDENMPACFSCGNPQDIYCLDCVQEKFEQWLEEAAEMVG